jgi:hypothetical protein
MVLFLGGLMKIRDHPNIIQWPPEWIASLDNEPLPSEKKEELLLREVEVLSPAPKDYHNYIRILAENGGGTWKSYRGGRTWKNYTSLKTGKTYTSLIIFMKDSEFLDRLYQKLKSSIGQTIREIGDSEI